MLLDSNICIYAANAAPPALDSILGREDLCIATVTRIETLGFHGLRPVERLWLETAFDRMRVLSLTDEIVEGAIRLRRERKMKLGDSIVAATALAYGVPLVTRDARGFRHVAGLEGIDPFRPGSA
jgi:predicted nucleic acid-binding protein